MVALLDKKESKAVHNILDEITTHYPQVIDICLYSIQAFDPMKTIYRTSCSQIHYSNKIIELEISLSQVMA